ncbi:RecB-family nuclease [Methanocaldococcus indicus]|uniref:RecB-family nuclease n=1 Tax=Methanocaldococcus indicus TaxID=213231 RepID=UPI003C6D41A5
MFICLHNTYSAKQVEEFGRIAFGFDVNTVIITKATASAAQSGVPTLQKMAYKLGKNMLFFEDLDDAIELLRPEKIYLIGNKNICDEKLNFEEVGKNDLVVFCGANTGFTKLELEKGLGRYIVENEIGALGNLAIFLYEINKLR